MIGVDPEFVAIMKKLKEDLDIDSDRATTKEIAKMLLGRKNKRKRIIL